MQDENNTYYSETKVQDEIHQTHGVDWSLIVIVSVFLLIIIALNITFIILLRHRKKT